MMPAAWSRRWIIPHLSHLGTRKIPTVVLFSSSSPPIVDLVTQEMKLAMKAKDSSKVSTIRMIRTGFQNAAIELKTDQLTNDQALAVLRKMAKQRKDSIDSFVAAGENDRAEDERSELKIMEQWLPATASEDVLRGWIREIISQEKLTHAGKLMGSLMKQHKNEVDGKLAQRLIKEELSNAS